MSIRVLIADDQSLVREGFGLIVKAQAGMEVVGEASDGNEAVELALTLRPDVVLMDIRMPGVDGLEATRRLLADPRSGSTRVLILTTFDLDAYVYEALHVGASGFLLKDTAAEQLVEGIRGVASGDSLLAPSITRRLIASFVRRPPPAAALPDLEELTAREREVLDLIARGCSNGEIATELVVSEATVKTHVAHVFSKLGLRDRVHAVVFAYESGLVQPGDDDQSRDREDTVSG
jgi:DNA-binding NarL/FixJ family response regulator